MENNGERFNQRDKKILVVDDQKESEACLKAFLEEEGCQVITVGDGLSAIHATQEQKIDLIIMDMRDAWFEWFGDSKKDLTGQRYPSHINDSLTPKRK